MRNNNKKVGKSMFYLFAGLILAVLLWIMSREMPISQESVEEPLKNTLVR